MTDADAAALAAIRERHEADERREDVRVALAHRDRSTLLQTVQAQVNTETRAVQAEQMAGNALDEIRRLVDLVQARDARIAELEQDVTRLDGLAATHLVNLGVAQARIAAILSGVRAAARTERS